MFWYVQAHQSCLSTQLTSMGNHGQSTSTGTSSQLSNRSTHGSSTCTYYEYSSTHAYS